MVRGSVPSGVNYNIALPAHSHQAGQAPVMQGQEKRYCSTFGLDPQLGRQRCELDLRVVVPWLVFQYLGSSLTSSFVLLLAQRIPSALELGLDER
jgi:hypothetical protein